MKKTVLFILTLIFIISLTSCNKEKPTDKNSSIDGFTSFENSLQKKELTKRDVKKLYIGMPYEEAIKILGEPHDYTGFGIVKPLYEIQGGMVLSVDYNYKTGCIECIRILDKNGKLTIKK